MLQPAQEVPFHLPGAGLVLPFPTAPPSGDARVEDYLQDGELVPVRRTSTGSEDVVATLRAASRAANTRTSYGRHVGAFADWCATQPGSPSPLPASTSTVLEHLAWYAIERDEHDRPVHTYGTLSQRVSTGTVGIRLAAINKVHVYAGFTPSGADPQVAQFIAGLKTTFGTAPRQRKAPIVHDDLAAMLSTFESDNFLLLRDQAILLLRAAGLSAGEMTRLEWAGVDVDAGTVHVRIDADGRGGPEVLRELRSPQPDTVGCGPHVFTTLRSKAPLPCSGPLLVAPGSRRALTRQGITAICNRRGVTLGGYGGLPGTGERLLAPLLGELNELSVAHSRNAALLTVGWWLALRRSNLARLTWGDVYVAETGDIELTLRRSKTDQEGRGRVKWLVDVSNPVRQPFVSPTQALLRWREVLAGLLGVRADLIPPGTAVFPHLSRSGTLSRDPGGELKAVSGDQINVIVQSVARSANLAAQGYEGDYTPFGAHSLRIGFVTEAVTRNKLDITAVMEVTDHVSPQVLMKYRRELNIREEGAVAQLARMLAADEAGATGERGAGRIQSSQVSPSSGPPVSRRRL